MLTLQFDEAEYFDDSKNEFIKKKALVVELEHSLVSLSKWESFFEKPFLTDEEKSREETVFYIKCMALNDVDIEVLESRLDNEAIAQINAYITAKMTATWFNENTNQPKSREVITAEVIYYWMVSLSIPIECENWHLNRLFTLIKVVNEKTQQASSNGKKKHMTKSDLASRRSLNEARKAQLGTNG